MQSTLTLIRRPRGATNLDLGESISPRPHLPLRKGVLTRQWLERLGTEGHGETLAVFWGLQEQVWRQFSSKHVAAAAWRPLLAGTGLREAGKGSSKPTDIWGDDVPSNLSLPPALGRSLRVLRTYCAAAWPWGRHPARSREWSSGPHREDHLWSSVPMARTRSEL